MEDRVKLFEDAFAEAGAGKNNQSDESYEFAEGNRNGLGELQGLRPWRGDHLSQLNVLVDFIIVMSTDVQ